MVVASRVRLRSPLTCPSGTFSPRAGRRASDLRWGDKLHGSNTLHASLLPACGEKVPNGRMRGASSSQEGLTAIHPIRCGLDDCAALLVATRGAPTGAAGDAVGDNAGARG